MRKRLLKLFVAGLAGELLAPLPAFAARCNQVSTVQDIDNGAETLSDLSDSAALICSVEFTASGANGYATVFDSPDDTLSHAQAVIKSEPGAATSGDSVDRNFGSDGRPTRHGLDVQVHRGTLVIQWSGTAP